MNHETITSSPVVLTGRAVKEVKRLMESGDTSGMLRIGVKGGGCSGMSYILGFDEKNEGDEEFDIEGVRCLINPAHAIYLMGMEIDWHDGLNSRGFTFTNPNASKTCGCGTSFAV